MRAHVAALGEVARGRKLIVRVDRTELSKNIVRGLTAYRELLATRPEWHGRVVHLAFAYPSRSDVPEYRAYTEQMRQIAAEITAEFGTPDWNPLILEVKDDYPRSLAACAVADVLLVNPVRDGMNLVAQEGPVLSERGCALVLSREAGAAATLDDAALLVNPYDVSETAAALHQALAMPETERRRRTAALAATAAASPPARWLGDQLASLERRLARAGAYRRRHGTIRDRSGTRSCGPASLYFGRDRGQQRHDPLRSLHHQVGLGRDLQGLGAGAGHGTTRDAFRAQGAYGGEGGQVAEIIAAEHDRIRGAFPGQAGQRGALVHARRSQLDDHPARFGRQSQPGGQVAQRAAEQPQRRFRVGRAAGVHGQRVPLVLDPGAVGGARRC